MYFHCLKSPLKNITETIINQFLLYSKPLSQYTILPNSPSSLNKETPNIEPVKESVKQNNVVYVFGVRMPKLFDKFLKKTIEKQKEIEGLGMGTKGEAEGRGKDGFKIEQEWLEITFEKKNQSCIQAKLIYSDQQSIKMIEKLFPQNQQSLQASKSLLELTLRTSVPIHHIESSNPKTTVKEEMDLELQLRDDVFMITHLPSQIVFGWLKSSPRLTILIQELNLGNKFKNESEKQRMAKLGVIRFSQADDPQHYISLFFPFDHQKIIELYRILPKTYTIQLGFHDLFTPLRKLGNGATGVVYEVIRKVDQAHLAVKAFKKSIYFPSHQGKGKEAFLNEFKILSECQHQSICRFQGTYETDNTIYVVQEYYQKSLASLLKRDQPLPRKQVLSVMEDLLRAVNYLHNKGIFHRDIKLDNIMLRKQGDAYRPVLIDFGMSDRIGNDNLLFPRCGTPGYLAPQIFTEGAKDPKGDVFSLGVIFHILLFKAPVFMGSSSQEVMHNNRLGNIVLDQTLLEAEDPLIKDLLLKMLRVDKLKRLQSHEALSHEVFRPKEVATPTTNPPSENNDHTPPMIFQLIQEEEYLVHS